MTRYLIAVPIACLYVAVAGWVVHSQGVAYRNGLHRPAIAVPTPTDRPLGSLAVKAEPAAKLTPVPRASAEPAGLLESPVPVAPATADTSGPAPSATKPVPPSTADAGALPPAKPPAEPGAGARAAWANSLDLTNLNPEDERRLGSELHEMIVSMIPPLETGPWLQRTSRVARSLSDTNYTITVLNSDAVEAFSHPGDFIYVCRGLFDLIGSDEDYALEFVIGHEMAHLNQKDALKSIAPGNAEAKKNGVDTVRQFLVPLALAYPDEREFQADAWSVRQMISRLGRTRREALAFVRKFQGYAERYEFGNGHKLPGPDVPMLENHFRAHPATWDRLDRLQLLTKTAPAASR